MKKFNFLRKKQTNSKRIQEKIIKAKLAYVLHLTNFVNLQSEKFQSGTWTRKKRSGQPQIYKNSTDQNPQIYENSTDRKSLIMIVQRNQSSSFPWKNEIKIYNNKIKKYV